MNKLKLALQRFMMGRYGMDTLYYVLMTIAMITLIVNIFVKHWSLTLVSLLFLLIALYRFYSKNTSARYRENAAFKRIISKTFGFIPRWRRRFKERKTHVYRTCPHCKATLRLKRIKGKHTVVCPKCTREFSVNVR